MIPKTRSRISTTPQRTSNTTALTLALQELLDALERDVAGPTEAEHAEEGLAVDGELLALPEREQHRLDEPPQHRRGQVQQSKRDQAALEDDADLGLGRV